MPKDLTTKEEILKNAKQLFGQFGFAGTSTQMIADAVGIKKPSLYYFFKNKEAIYVYLLDVVITEVQELFESKGDTKGSFQDKLTSLFKISKDNGPFIFSVHTLSIESHERIMVISKKMCSAMLGYLKSQKMNCPPKDSLTVIFDITQNYARRAAQKEKVMSPKRYATLLINLLN